MASSTRHFLSKACIKSSTFQPSISLFLTHAYVPECSREAPFPQLSSSAIFYRSKRIATKLQRETMCVITSLQLTLTKMFSRSIVLMAIAIAGALSIPTPVNMTSLIQSRADSYGVRKSCGLFLNMNYDAKCRCFSGLPTTMMTSAKAHRVIRYTSIMPIVYQSTTRWTLLGSIGVQKARLSTVVLMSSQMMNARIMRRLHGKRKTVIVAV